MPLGLERKVRTMHTTSARSRAWFVSALALALAAAALLAWPATANADAAEEVRNDGANRYETAVEVAEAAFPDPDAVDDVLLATGEDFADALSAAALAGVVEGPILLTRTATLPDAVADAISDFDPETVHLLGGDAAISPAVADEVADLGVATNRIAGDDRFATAAEVAAAIVTEGLGGEIGEVDGASTVLLADGRNFPDAIAAGPGAYAGTHPILLTDTDALPEATTTALADLDVDQVAILGGPSAVSDDVAEALAEDYDVARLAGADRDETAAEVARFFVGNLDFDPANVGLATGADAFDGADALAAAPYLGAAQAPLLLTGSLPQPTADFLAEYADDVATLHVFGGDVVVDGDTVAAAQEAASERAARVALGALSLERYLADSTTGLSLYRFDNDEPGESNCEGDCLEAWPPLTTDADPIAAPGVDADLLGTIEREDGTTQVTYDDWPLYFFAGDEEPGDVDGQGVNDVWWLVQPDGDRLQTRVGLEELGEFGEALVGADGFALYRFTNDERDERTCEGECLANWPALITVDGVDAIAGDGVDADLLGTIPFDADDDDRTVQVTYDGWPLYFFAGDEEPGDVNGQGLNDVWYLVDAEGELIGADD